LITERRASDDELTTPSCQGQKTTASQDQARQASASDGAGERPASLLTEGQHASKLIGDWCEHAIAIFWITIANFWTTEAV
jgi:hypothetical protein